MFSFLGFKFHCSFHSVILALLKGEKEDWLTQENSVMPHKGNVPTILVIRINNLGALNLFLACCSLLFTLSWVLLWLPSLKCDFSDDSIKAFQNTAQSIWLLVICLLSNLMFTAWEIGPWYVPPCLVVWWEGVYFPRMLCTRKLRKISVLIPATFWNHFALQSPPSPEYHLRASQKISYLKKGMFLTLSIMLIFFLSLKIS